MLMHMWRESAPLALLGLVVSLAAVGMALVYAIRPSEQRLALMRPLSLAAVFAALTSFTMGLSAILAGIAVSGTLTAKAWDAVAGGVASAMTTLVVAFGCLTVAWLLVTLGLRRT